MKHYTLFLCYSLLINTSLNAQYYEKVYLPFYFQEAEKVLPVNDTTYAVLIGTRTQGEYHYESGLLFVDKYGQIIDSVHYQQDSTNYYSTALLANEQGFAIAVAKDLDTHNYSQYHDNMYFVQTDYSGHILYQNAIGYPGNTNSNDLMSMIHTPEDGGYLLVGWISLPFGAYYRPYLVKLNANGEKQWEKIINDYNPNLDSRLFDVVHTNEGYFAVGSINSNSNTGVGDIILAQIDITNGSFINEWIYNFDDYYGSSGFDWGRNLLALDDGGFIISGGNQTPPQVGYLLRLDSNKNLVWFNDSTNYDCGVAQTRYLPTDGSFVTTGCATVLYPEVSNGVQVEISKVSATGALLWKRHYGVDGADDYAWDMINTPDGGFMVVGRSYSFFWQQTPIYLLRTNCMGLLTQPQANFTAQIDTALLTATFQNLSQYTYPDSIDGGHYLWDFGDGATSNQINPTHTYAQGGNYTVTLTAVVCSDTSVYTLPISTYAVGINQVLPLEGGVRGGLCTVLPNPANEQISINSLKPLSGTFVLYDVLGREVLRQVITNRQTNIAVSHLPNGLYYCKIGQTINKLLIAH